jgi:hypothetical protein
MFLVLSLVPAAEQNNMTSTSANRQMLRDNELPTADVLHNVLPDENPSAVLDSSWHGHHA